MSILLFAIFDADAARSGREQTQRRLAKAQEAYDKAGRTVAARASSRSPEVRHRASAALTAALDMLDECRIADEKAQERVTATEKVEMEAQAQAKTLMLFDQESPELRQHRDCHNNDARR